MILEETPFHCGQVVNPDEDERDHQVPVCPVALGSSTWTDVCCMPMVVICVLFVTDTRVKEPGSATDANVDI